MGSRGVFRSIFAPEEHDSSQIDPRAAGKDPQFVLALASVAGLVVPGVEAELEDGGLDVVPFVLLLLGNVFHHLSGAHRFQLLGQEVAPLVLRPVARIGNAERTAPCPLGLMDLPGPRVGDPDRIAAALIQQVAGLAALDAGEHAVDRKRPVVGILVGPVAVDGLNGRAGRCLALGYGLLVEGVVSSRGTLHLYTGYQGRRILLIGGLRDVHAVALHLLLPLLTIFRLRVIRVLDTVSRDELLVAGRHLPMLNDKLFFEHLFKKSVLGLHTHQDSVNDSPQFGKALMDGLRVAPVRGQLCVLLQPWLDLLPKGGFRRLIYCPTS